MAVTETTLPGNGTAGPFTYTFPALEAAHVKVSVDNIAKTVGVDYSLDFVQKQITFLVAPYPTAAQTIRIYRETDDAALEATFYSGAAIRATDLNNNFTQALYIAQETQTFAAGIDASAIATTAATALTNSQQALTTAQNAETTANGIASTANTALSTANSANTTANTANTTANTAAAAVSGKLDKTGGTMTGDIVFNTTQTYPKVPQNAKTSAYTLVAADAGKHISITTGGVTVPSGVFAVGDAVSIYNNSSNSQTINQGTSVTLRLAGSTSTGNRTLFQYGLCTILCVASNTFVISGAVIS